jgi:membrane protease YdiL (CAAX protease family)
MGSQFVAGIAAVLAYFIGEAIGGNIDQSSLANGDISRIQREFVSEYTQQILIAACVLTILIILLIVKINRKKIREVFVIKPLAFSKAAAVFVLGISINIATVLALSVIPIPEEVMKQYEELVGNAVISDNFWLTFLTTALLVPITEELVFRGMSFNIMRRGMSLTLAVILQTLLFAGAHILPLQITYVIPTALSLGLVYVWCGSFIAPIILHISYNGLSAVLSAIPSAAETVEGQAALYESVIIMLIAMAATAACIIFLYKRRERLPAAARVEDPQPELYE